MHILLVGLNHRSAPIDVRERLAFPPEELGGALAALRQDVGLEEAAILSTCNRVEIYGGAANLEETVARLQRFLSDRARIEMAGLAPRLYTYTEPRSVHHLFSVASGLDSMVLGEGEILHQVKHAYERARDHGATGKLLNGLFQRALNAAKAVRSQTAIGQGATSIGTVSVELAAKIFGRLSGAVVVLIGAGKIGEVTLARLVDRGVRHIRVMNRSWERAATLAFSHHAAAVPMETLPEQLVEADILITATSAPRYLLRREEVAAAMRARHQRPLCLVDLGVPRNVEPSCGILDNVYRFDVDDLQGLVGRSQEERVQALDACHVIIDHKVERFLLWWRQEMTACDPSSSVLAAAR